MGWVMTSDPATEIIFHNFFHFAIGTVAGIFGLLACIAWHCAKIKW